MNRGGLRVTLTAQYTHTIIGGTRTRFIGAWCGWYRTHGTHRSSMHVTHEWRLGYRL